MEGTLDARCRAEDARVRRLGFGMFMSSESPVPYLLLGCLTLGVVSLIAATPSPVRLERTNLLTYRNEQGDIVPVKTVADCKRRRAPILQGMPQAMGPLPGK